MVEKAERFWRAFYTGPGPEIYRMVEKAERFWRAFHTGPGPEI